MKHLKQKNDMRKIKLNELKNVFNKMILKLESEDIQEIEFSNDLYRIIPTDQWASFDGPIIENCSLFDDIEQIKKLAAEQNRPCTYVDFDRLASILREISQIKNPV